MGSPSRIEETLRSIPPVSQPPGREELAARLARLELAAGEPGWSSAEWAEHLAEPLPEAGELAARTQGVVLLAPHASELALAPLARAVAYLERGERVLLVVPREIPALAGVWRAALEGSSGWALVEDDGLGLLRAAAAHPETGVLDARAPPARAKELAGLSATHSGSAAAHVRVLRNTSLLVRRSDDPAELARAALQRAFGRVAALSGQRAGALGRIVCHERSFSSFSAALLAGLEAAGDFTRPVPLLERAMRAHLSAARTLGLDEGATLVLSRRESGACVFTNVDERMRLASLARCAGLLVLLRCTSDEEGAALAERLDRDARAEDLAEKV